MLNVPGYAVGELLWEDREFQVYRASRSSDATPVLIKVPATRQAALTVALEQEFLLAERLDPAWAVMPLQLVRQSDNLALVLADTDARPLDPRTFPLTLDAFFPLAAAMVTAVASLHQAGVVHQALGLRHVLAGPSGVRLTGVGVPWQAEGVRTIGEEMLACLAPEQTGQMTRVADGRTDLYALGALWYRLLTGRPPVEGGDLLEWMHAIIAREPCPPRELRPDLPAPLADILTLLLAKAPEERYQSAAGLLIDLEGCRAAWAHDGAIPDFALANQDVTDRMLISRKLYGREEPLEALTAAYTRMAERGRPTLALVAGYSGVGKTVLVAEFWKTVLAGRALYLAGKFDQYSREIPYATIVQGFRELVQQILSESKERVAAWRERLLDAVGNNGQVIIDVIPQVALIIGEQPPLPELPLTEAQNRFNRVFRQFIGVFAQPDHPLVLFFDDLQWVDAASVQLIQHIITHSETRHLMVLGAYRENEVGPDHPVRALVTTVREAGVPVQQVPLAPLTLESVTQFIADTLHTMPLHALPLAQQLFRGTGGNPFLCVQFLTALNREGSVYFDRDRLAWAWKLEEIATRGMSENVVDFLVAKLKRLPEATQHTLGYLAALGNRVERHVLSQLTGLALPALERCLHDAIHDELVLARGGTYQFTHDRVQQAAFSLVPEETRSALHLHIGRTLRDAMPTEGAEALVFDIASQLNLGSALIGDPEERIRTAELNLYAGRKAKTSTAYAAAHHFFTAGAALLPSGAWTAHYALTFALDVERAECDFLLGDFTEAEALLTELREHAATTLDAAAVYRMMVDFYTIKDEVPHAFESGIRCLALFGIDLSAHPTRAEVEAEYARTWALLGDRRVEDLLEQPPIQSKEMLAVLDTLAALLPPALFTDNNLFAMISCLAVNTCLNYGNAESATMAYALFGSTLCGYFGEYQKGYAFGKLAFDLVERHGYQNARAKVCLIFGDLVNFWTQPFTSDLDYMRMGFRAAVETGDVGYACYNANHIVTLMIVQGFRLDEVLRESEVQLDFVRRAHYEAVVDEITSMQRLVQCLRGQTAAIDTFSGDEFDQDAFEEHLTRRRTLTRCWYYILKVQARFMAGDAAGALQAAEAAEAELWSTISHVQVPEFFFYTALALSVALPEMPAGERLAAMTRLREIRTRYAAWAEHSPTNYRNRLALLDAELARLDGNAEAAALGYAAAVQYAHDDGFVQNEGIAHEAAARWALARNDQAAAQSHLRDARACFIRWGALGKVQQLAATYASLIETEEAEPVRDTGHLDLIALMKTTQAISGEIVLPRLVETLLRIVVEHAGAEGGSLVLLRDGEAEITATASVKGGAIVAALCHEPPDGFNLPQSIVNYVLRTGERVLLSDAAQPHPFAGDPYMRECGPRSVLCLPITRQGAQIGLVYLENNLLTGVFSEERTVSLEMIAAQAAISLENARLYDDLQREVAERRQAEEALRLRESRLHALLQLSEMADAGVEAVSDFALEKAVALTDSVFGYLAYLDETGEITGDRLRRAPGYEVPEPTFDELTELCHNMLVQRKPLLINALPFGGALTRVLAVPLMDGDALVAVAAVGNKPEAYDDSDTMQLRLLMENTWRLQQRTRAAEAIGRMNQELEERVEERTAQLEDVNRRLQRSNDELSHFAYIASHDLQEPLRKVIAFGDRLKAQYHDALGESGLDYLERIQRAGLRMRRLIEDLLEYSRVTTHGKPFEPVNLQPLVAEVLDDLEQRIADSGGTVEVEPLPWVYGDGRQLQQLFQNLIGNALKFAKTDTPPQVHITCRHLDGGHVEIAVADNGIGFDEQYRDRIFAPFQRLHGRDEYEGTGIGLAICQKIIFRHGGAISAHSRSGLGATFRFSLPASCLDEVPVA